MPKQQITQAGDEHNRLLRKIKAVRRMRTNVAEIETILADCREDLIEAEARLDAEYPRQNRFGKVIPITSARSSQEVAHA